MIPGMESLIPEGYDSWPRSIQKRYVQELYALYFPEASPQAGSATVPGAKVIPLRRGTKGTSSTRDPDGDAS